MTHRRIAATLACLAMLAALVMPAAAQVNVGSARIAALTFNGSRYPAEHITSLLRVSVGDMVTRAEIQAAADRLAACGLFSEVHYRFNTLTDGVEVEFQLADAPTYPVFFDNFPWFSDQQFIEEIRKAAPYFDGTAPEHGAILDHIIDATVQILARFDVHGKVEMAMVERADNDQMVHQLHFTGPALKIGALEIDHELPKSDPKVGQLMRSLMGTPYSRLGLLIFCFEHVRPLFLARGQLEVKCGLPRARFVGYPDKPLPDQVHVNIDVVPGPVYHWGGATWTGAAAFGPAALNNFLGMAEGELAEGNKIFSAFDRIRDEYGKRGYVDFTMKPAAQFNRAAGRVVYQVEISEGPVYHMGDLVITGLSLAAERRLLEMWRLKKGELFDRTYFDSFLSTGVKNAFEGMVVNYNQVGHWLRTDPQKKIVDVLLDFK
ncbi:MAG TPA: POTRA domain-containing protein [Candidatus Acidoferrales bacterium]